MQGQVFYSHNDGYRAHVVFCRCILVQPNRLSMMSCSVLFWCSHAIRFVCPTRLPIRSSPDACGIQARLHAHPIPPSLSRQENRKTDSFNAGSKAHATQAATKRSNDEHGRRIRDSRPVQNACKMERRENAHVLVIVTVDNRPTMACLRDANSMLERMDGLVAPRMRVVSLWQRKRLI